MWKKLAVVIGMAAVALTLLYQRMPGDAHLDLNKTAAGDTECAGPRNLNVAQITKAQEDGLPINQRHRCVDRAGLEVAKAALAQHAAQQASEAQASALACEREQLAAKMSLEQARAGFATAWTMPEASGAQRLPNPPASQFVRSDYASGALKLVGYLSKTDAAKLRPAVVWITGGVYQALDDSFWQATNPEYDQTVQAFRKAGIVVYLPTLRGGHVQTGGSGGGVMDFGFGEVDDVLAAAAHLARQPGVDPERMYLGGMSNGASLALLVAGMGEPARRFKAVFALGPSAGVPSIPDLVTQRDGINTDEALERKLRSPKLWLHAATQPVHVMEGLADTSDQDLKQLCEPPRNPQMVCYRLKGVMHRQLVAATSGRIAAGLVQAQAVGGAFAMPGLDDLLSNK